VATVDTTISENENLIAEPLGEESIVPIYIDTEVNPDAWSTDEKILFFYSENSEKSKEFDAILQSDEKPQFYSDIIKVNFDEESSAKEDFEISSANSFALIDENLSLIKKIEDISNLEEIITLYE